MKTLRYVGGSTVRVITALDLKTLGVSGHDIIVDTRLNRDVVVSNAVAKAIMAGDNSARAEWRIIQDHIEDEDGPELAPIPDSEIFSGGPDGDDEVARSQDSPVTDGVGTPPIVKPIKSTKP